MKKDSYDINSNPAYRLGAVMETYCDRNSYHSLQGIEPHGYDKNGEMTGFDVLYEVTDELLNDGYAVETHNNADAMELIKLRMSQGYEVYPVQISNDQTTVVSVRKLPVKEQNYSARTR